MRLHFIVLVYNLARSPNTRRVIHNKVVKVELVYKVERTAENRELILRTGVDLVTSTMCMLKLGNKSI